jgi:hypothetical protein
VGTNATYKSAQFMKWAISWMGCNTYISYLENVIGREHLDDGKMILKWYFYHQNGEKNHTYNDS